MVAEQINIFELTKPKYKIKKPIRLIELFAGIGSQAKAFKNINANFEHYRVVDFDKYAIRSYNAIYNTDFPVLDITKINGNDLGIINTKKFEYIMTYSFPCQDLSIAGNQKGMKKGDNTRSGLLWEVERLLDECRELPQVLLMENVPQVIGKGNFKDFRKWQLKLESLGYSNYFKLLNAKDYSIPQNRNRCFMVSILGDYYYEFPKKKKLKLKLKDMLEDEVDEKYFLSEKLINYFKENSIKNEEKGNGFRFSPLKTQTRLSKCVTTRAGSRMDDNFIIQRPRGYNKGGYRQPCIIIPEDTKRGYKEAYEGDGVYINRPHQKRGCVQTNMIQTIKTSGDDVGVVVVDDLYANREKRVYEDVCPTLRSERHGLKVLEKSQLRIRRLTPKECWRLMGFSDEDFEKASKVNSNSQLYKQAGNSIVVNVLEAIFKELINW